jgi:hypothetical protein
MADFVYLGEARWTELRIHGVSGTPPASTLEHPDVRRIAGDRASGFFRRVWPARSVSADGPEAVLESYSWGGLTAGSPARALWLLLAPFLLVNVAFYARPVHRPGFWQSFGEAVQRLFALTVTATLVLATVNVTMDFAAWQCVRPAPATSCGSAAVSWLSWPWLADPARRIAITALLPIAVIGLLWWLAARTWDTNEGVGTVRAPSAPGEPPAEERSPLENRRMWNGSRPVRLLRAVHVTEAFTLVGMLALAPFATGPHRPAAGFTLFAVFLALGVACVVLACLPAMSDRPPAEQTSVDAVGLGIVWLARVAAGLLAVTLLWLAIATPEPIRPAGAPRTTLPWMSAAVHAGIAAQAILLAVMVVLLLTVLRSRTAGVAWRGFATAVLMLFGSALSGSYAAALVLAVAHVLGKPMPQGRGVDALATPMPYFWAAALAPVLAIVALGLVVAGCLITRHTAGHAELTRVEQRYDDAGADGHRAAMIARQWATAGLDRLGRILSGTFAVITALLLIGTVAFYLADSTAAVDQRPIAVLANVGDWLIGLFAAGMVYLGRLTYKNANTRRLVGVIWDLGTFWPRAVHPLAPPCYAERAVPQLIKRIDHLRAAGNVLLSCHSQGTVLGAAVINQLTYGQSRSVAFLTYGSPLCRLYAPFFPVYFGPEQLRLTGSFLLGGRDRPMDRWPWRNLYRPSDPIGGSIFPVIDEELTDPLFAMPADDIAYPPTLGHSFYPIDPAWPGAVQAVQGLR